MPGDPEPTATKLLPCRECNRLTAVNKYTSKLPRCQDCRETAMTDAIRQIAQKSGPYYDKLVSRRRFQQAVKGRGGESIKNMLIEPGQNG